MLFIYPNIIPSDKNLLLQLWPWPLEHDRPDDPARHETMCRRPCLVRRKSASCPAAPLHVLAPCVRCMHPCADPSPRVEEKSFRCSHQRKHTTFGRSGRNWTCTWRIQKRRHLRCRSHRSQTTKPFTPPRLACTITSPTTSTVRDAHHDNCLS